MDYSIACDCGRTTRVTAQQAGVTIRCACGEHVLVPRLSQLRATAGETPYPNDTIGRIRAMIAGGELPTGQICPVSGRTADTTVFFRIQCERVWVEEGWSHHTAMAFVLLFGWLGALLAAEHTKPRQEFGRDLWVDVPLRVSSEARDRILKLRRQRRLRQLLGQVDAYAELFREYPRAVIEPLSGAAYYWMPIERL